MWAETRIRREETTLKPRFVGFTNVRAEARTYLEARTTSIRVRYTVSPGVNFGLTFAGDEGYGMPLSRNS